MPKIDPISTAAPPDSAPLRDEIPAAPPWARVMIALSFHLFLALLAVANNAPDLLMLPELTLMHQIGIVMPETWPDLLQGRPLQPTYWPYLLLGAIITGLAMGADKILSLWPRKGEKFPGG